jgi:DnaJ-class molecular chaperone
MNTSIFLILMFILLLYAVYRGAKAANSKKRDICTRCNGEGYWKVRDYEEMCNRCNGTGELLKNTNSRRTYKSWE